MKKQLTEFIKKYPHKSFPKEEVILYPGQTPPSLFYLQKGFVRQYITSDEGKELTVHIYEQGSVFPLNWALNNANVDYNLQTITSCTIILVPAKDFIDLIKSDPEISLELTQKMLKGLEGLSKRLEIVSFSNANQRVRSTLMYLKKHFGNKYRFSHEDIASLTGLTRERVSIEMKKLKDSGEINYKHANVTLITESTSK